MAIVIENPTDFEFPDIGSIIDRYIGSQKIIKWIIFLEVESPKGGVYEGLANAFVFLEDADEEELVRLLGDDQVSYQEDDECAAEIQKWKDSLAKESIPLNIGPAPDEQKMTEIFLGSTSI